MIERLDDTGLRDLAQRTHPLGVLSVYVDADRNQDPNLQAAAIDLKNRFRELQRRFRQDASSERSQDVVVRLERLWPRLEDLVSPAASGRSRIMFAALDDEWVLRLESAMPAASRVVLDDGPFIHPLLELLDEGRPAGAVIVSAQHARLLEWRLGSLETVRQIEQEYGEAAHERAGQIGGGPSGQFHTPMREQRESRERDRTERFLDQVTVAAEQLMAERGWQRLLVSGGERWTEPTISRLSQALRDKVISDPRVLSGLDDAALAAAVTGRFHDQHKEYERRLLEQVREAAGSGRAALGLSEVAAVLNDGRVTHLVYDPEVRYTGTVDADGALYGGEETAPGGLETVPEPRLTERLVERALNTGARVSPIEGAANGILKDARGIAALLRW